MTRSPRLKLGDVAGVTAYGALFLGETLSPIKIVSIILIGFGVAGLAAMER